MNSGMVARLIPVTVNITVTTRRVGSNIRASPAREISVDPGRPKGWRAPALADGFSFIARYNRCLTHRRLLCIEARFILAGITLIGFIDKKSHTVQLINAAPVFPF
jgi:hypothetical protein